jgi:hypothetical protein
MQYDEELARMRAQMLAKEDEESPVFDDGARFLGQNPNMMQVGLFGRPKKPVAPPTAPPVNLQRRSILGLTPLPAELPAVIPPAQPKLTPQQMEQAVKPQATFPGPHPDVWAGGPSFMSMGDLGDVVKRYTEKNYPASQPATPATPAAPSADPLQTLADKALNAPMSRRDVLKRAGQAALQQVVPMPSVTDVAPQVMSPLTEVATTTAATAASGMPPAIAAVIRDMLKERMGDVMEYGEDEIPITVEKFLGYAPDFDPALKKDITRELKEYNDLTQEKGQYLERYDDIRDREYELSEYLEPLVDRMPGDKAWQELTSHMEFEDYLNENGAIGLAKQFRKSGATKAEVLDFLDTYYEGFDPDDTDFMRSLNRLYSKPLAQPKPKATKSKSKDK